jgi:hypothetical protein
MKNLMIMDKEEILERVENKESLDKKEQLKRYKIKFETVLNWLYISYNGKESLWKQLE